MPVQSDDDSDFLGLQNAWIERDSTRPVSMAFHRIGGAAVLHPAEANPGMYVDQFWTPEMWTQLTNETNRYATQETQQNPPPPIWTPVYMYVQALFNDSKNMVSK